MELNVHFDHQDLRRSVIESLEHAVSGRSVAPIVQLCKPMIEQANHGVDVDVRSIVDSAFKDALQTYFLSAENANLEPYDLLLTLSIEAATNEICAKNLPVNLLSDLFDCRTLEQCEQLFSLVENRVNIWKEPTFFKNVKTQLLRACNDLLRRLSRSQNTVFCGRILVFLARFFPLFERSGLNLISEFNHDNVITIALQDEGEVSEIVASTDLEEGEMPTTDVGQVDYNLYRKFWQLQELFRSPGSCYNKANWKQLQSFSNDVLSVFATHKLDPSLNSAAAKSKSDDTYFSKYLTNQKLLDLQFGDPNFRRYILVQFLITFQYLTAPVRFKNESQVLTEEQLEWVQENTSKVYTLIEETPPNGLEMRKCVRNILHREEFWNYWKNEGCSDMKPSDRVEPAPPTKKRKIGDELRTTAGTGKVFLGNPELTRLWNLCPDNWQACRSKQRLFTPTIENFFEPVVNGSENSRQNKIYGDSHFTWRSLRLLSQKSPHFFVPSNQMVKPLGGYLESVVEKLTKEMAAGDSKNVPDISVEDAEDISDDELLKHVDEGVNSTEAHVNGEAANGVNGLVMKDLLDIVAEKVPQDWKKLAPHLFNFEEDEIIYFESTHPDDISAQCRLMLTVWTEQDEPTNVTAERLQSVLEKCGIELTLPGLSDSSQDDTSQ